MKHVIKRLRMAMKRARGVAICDTVFNRRLITRLLVDAGICTTERADSMFGEGDMDAQNVEACNKLLQAVSGP